ncbi:hypothetical protein [Streptomyces rubiginosohelvolus]|uniref:Uncharacterized protein n=1 Tax=Streptomyces rubiginosohelvolus TaxID=67362 RepID=A0ABQ3BF90_9ACTN|nr:hypothetical protein [Streptomyces pluricolorescens]GGZ42468.1 hypothetical protein GCM10010328_15460 [Streptomyces pluricolorescens]
MTTHRNPAKPALAPESGRALRVVAEGVPAAVRPDKRARDGRYPIAWLTITAPRGVTPTATSICQCGRNLFAAGHHKALALIADHTDHKTRCPLRADQEGAAA